MGVNEAAWRKKKDRGATAWKAVAFSGLPSK